MARSVSPKVHMRPPREHDHLTFRRIHGQRRRASITPGLLGGQAVSFAAAILMTGCSRCSALIGRTRRFEAGSGDDNHPRLASHLFPRPASCWTKASLAPARRQSGPTALRIAGTACTAISANLHLVHCLGADLHQRHREGVESESDRPWCNGLSSSALFTCWHFNAISSLAAALVLRNGRRRLRVRFLKALDVRGQPLCGTHCAGGQVDKTAQAAVELARTQASRHFGGEGLAGESRWR